MLSFIAKEELEKVNEIFKVVFKLSLIIGGLVMMCYYYAIGFIPYELSIGDGLFFIAVAISFGFIYLLFITLFTCVGFKFRCILLIIKKLYLKIRKQRESSDELLSMIPRETDKVIWIPSVFGWLLITKLSFSNNISNSFESLIMLIFLSWLCAHCVSSYWEIKKEEATKPRLLRENWKQLKSIYLVVIFLSPVFIGGLMSTMSTGAMRLMKIRQDNTTVHVGSPYNNFPLEAGVKGLPSQMGKEYLKFNNVDVLYTGPGKNTVLQFNSLGNHTFKLIFPSEFVFIQN